VNACVELQKKKNGCNPVTLYDSQELTKGEPHHKKKDHAPSSLYLAVTPVGSLTLSTQYPQPVHAAEQDREVTIFST